MHLLLSSRAAAGLHEVFESLKIGKGRLFAGLDVSSDTSQCSTVARMNADDEGDNGVSWRPVFRLGMIWISHAGESNRRGLPSDYRGFQGTYFPTPSAS